MHTRRNRGFTYVGVLFAVALAGVALAGAGQLWSTAVQREREAELLFVGEQFRQAIERYYEHSPGAPRYPDRLEALLADERFVVTRRHLRRLYVDPMTGRADWALVRRPDGGILGVHSRSDAVPRKKSGFGWRYASFDDAASYRDWVFVHRSDETPPAAVTPEPPAAVAPEPPAAVAPEPPTVVTPAPPPQADDSVDDDDDKVVRPPIRFPPRKR